MDLETQNRYCERISVNISDWKSRWRRGGDQLRRIENNLADLEAQLSEAENDMQGLQISGLPGRAARLFGGLVGQGLSAADAARVASEARRIQSQINFINQKIRGLSAKRSDVENKLENLLKNIQDGQDKFVEYRCFELGLSHENLNAP